MQPSPLYQLRATHGGVVYAGGRRWVGPGPQHSKLDQSLSVYLNDDGRLLIHSFAGDSFRDCARHLGLEGVDARPADRATRDRLRREREAEARKREAADQELCRSIWARSEPLSGSPAERYLFSRGLVIDGCEDVRWHPSAPRFKPRANRSGPPPHPAMVSLVRAANGTPTGLHLTYVTRDGRKAFGDASRLMFGKTSGGAVRLRRPQDGTLAVAEGLETASSFDCLFGVPTWSALSVPGLSNFMPPRGVTRLLVAADGDEPGMRAAKALAERVRDRCTVELHPATDGRDWNDEWKREASQ